MLFNTSEKTKNEYVNEILSNDSFTDLKLDLIDLDLKIKAGDHFEVHYRGPVDKKPSLVFNENLLEIKEPKVEIFLASPVTAAACAVAGEIVEG